MCACGALNRRATPYTPPPLFQRSPSPNGVPDEPARWGEKQGEAFEVGAFNGPPPSSE